MQPGPVAESQSWTRTSDEEKPAPGHMGPTANPQLLLILVHGQPKPPRDRGQVEDPADLPSLCSWAAAHRDRAPNEGQKEDSGALTRGPGFPGSPFSPTPGTP